MGLKLFDDDETDNVDVSNIEIDKEFARRYEHNKKREALQRYEELKKKGQIEDLDSEPDSESSDEEDEVELNRLSKREDIKKLFENLIKVKRHDPSVYQNVKFFESESESDDDRKEENNGSKKKAKYLKDVVAQHLIEEGPEFEDAEPSKMKKMKTYSEEQEELKKAFLDEVKNLEENGDDGDLLKVKEKKNEVEDDDREFEKKLSEYFGPDRALDENSKFLKEFFEKRMWVDRENKDRMSVDGDEVDDLLRDDEEIERQEKYEESYNFRYEENAGDRVAGHSRRAEGSVRKKHNSRKEQRKNKMERMKIADMERKEELKHLKNLKKKEMKERLMKVMEVAGVTGDNDFPVDLDDLEEDFDPAEYDRMMKKAFGEKYYNADDADPEFGSDQDDDGDFKKPDFDKEDELLGLPEGWDAVENSGDSFLAARKKILEKMADHDNDHDDEDDDKEEKDERSGAVEENGNDDADEEEEEERAKENEESEQRRKRKRKMSLVQRAKEAMLEEYYKLDYEDTIGDLKTRFKYAKVKPNRFGLKAEEILMLDEKELNQFVSVKKIAPFREKEWKVPNNKRYEYKMKVRERLLRAKLNHGKTSKKKSSRENGDKSTSIVGSHQDGKPQLEETNVETGNVSRRANRKHRQAGLKLSKSRQAAYLNIQSKPKAKKRH